MTTAQRKSHLVPEEVKPLISAKRVDGTRVFNRAGEHIGDVDDVMINRRTGQVAFAIMSFGGWLGIGEKYHPLPWSMLDYDPAQEGYVIDIGREALERAPSYTRHELTGEHAWRERIFLYYGSGPSGA